MFIGKFHGVISAYTPLGLRKVITSLSGSAPGRLGVSRRFTSSAAQRKISADSATSSRASVCSGLPCSRVSSCGELGPALVEQVGDPVQQLGSLERWHRLHGICAGAGGSGTAASTSSVVASATSARCSPVTGLRSVTGPRVGPAAVDQQLRPSSEQLVCGRMPVLQLRTERLLRNQLRVDHCATESVVNVQHRVRCPVLSGPTSATATLPNRDRPADARLRRELPLAGPGDRPRRRPTRTLHLPTGGRRGGRSRAVRARRRRHRWHDSGGRWSCSTRSPSAGVRPAATAAW